ncbi:MAG: hypothetical protein IJE25_08850 [Clostridia bacterium]|nr:hypothetical protein [Clostridia bacterium]
MPFIIIPIVFVLLTALALLPFFARLTLTVREETELEITLAVFKLTLYNFSEGGGKVEKGFLLRLKDRILRLLSRCDVSLEELRIPSARLAPYSPESFIAPYLYHLTICSAIAYLRSISQKLIIGDNAVVLIPDSGSGFSLRLSARARVLHVLFALVGILLDKKATEEKRIGNVGN